MSEKMKCPYTYEYKDGITSTIGKEEMYDAQTRHDDLRIIERFIEYDTKKPKEVAYFTYILEKREDEGEWERYIKVVKLCKTYNVPRELREKKALMVSQDEMLSAVWKNDINFLCLYVNIPEEESGKKDDEENKDTVKGFYYLYGVQCVMRLYNHFYGTGSMPIFYDENTSEAEKVAQTLKVLKEQADAKYNGLISLLRGNFRQAQFLPLSMKEATAIQATIDNAKQLQVIRGIPKTHISAASGVTTSLEGITTTPEGIEQNEEFIRGMLHDKYANIIMAVPIPHSEILQWSDNTAKELSRYKSQYSGMVSHNAGVSIPVVFAGNLSSTLGNTSGVTDTNGTTTGVTQGVTDTVSHGVGTSEGTSHTVGYSNGQSVGIADSTSQANTDSMSQGLSQSRTMSDSVGVSQTESNGTTHGVTNTESIGRSHTVGRSETFGESETQAYSKNHSLGQSATLGHTSGETLGQTEGITRGHTLGNTHGTSFTNGHTIGDTLGHTVGNTYGVTEGVTRGHTVGETLGHTVGTTRGETLGTTHGTTVGNTIGFTEGVTRGHTIGNTIGNTITDGVSMGNSSSYGGSHSLSNGTSASVGVSQNTGLSQSAGHTIGSSATNSSSANISVNHGWSESGGNSFSHNGGSSNGWSGNYSESGGGSWNRNGSFGGDFGGKGFGFSAGVSGSTGTGIGFSDSRGTGHGSSDSFTNSDGYGGSYSQGVTGGIGRGKGATSALGITDSNSFTSGLSQSVGQSQSQGQSHSTSDGNSWSNGTSYSNTHSTGHTNSQSISDSLSHSQSRSNSQSLSRSLSESDSYSLSRSNSNSLSRSASDSLSNSLSHSNSRSLSDSFSHSVSNSLSRGITDSFSDSRSLSNSLSNSHSLSRSTSLSRGLTEGFSEGYSHGFGKTHSIGTTVSDGVTQSLSRGVSDSTSHTMSNGVTRSQSIGNSIGQTESLSHGTSTGVGKTANQGLSRSLSDSQGVTQGTSTSDSRSNGKSTSNSDSLSNSQGLSTARSSALGTGQGMNVSFGPTFGVSRSYQVFDENKGNLIKLLEVSNTRWNLAVRMGAFHVDAYVVSYTPRAAQSIALTAVTSWGGDNELGTVQCVTPGELTQAHLLKHASVLEPCTMKDSTPEIADNYVWSTIMLTSELAALTHLPRVETGGASTVATNIPPFSVFANKNGEIFFGKQINYEDGEPSYSYHFSKKEFMHTLICGASGSGKTTSAVRMAREVIRNYPDMKIFALDWKNSWRVLKRFAPNGVDDFEFFGLDYSSVRPIRMNLFIPPKHVGYIQWSDKVVESLCLGYGFGNKMYGVLKNAVRVSMLINGVLVMDENDDPVEMKPNNEAEQNLLNQKVAKVTMKQVYEIVLAMKKGELKVGTSLANSIAAVQDPRAREYIEAKFGKQSGQGMQDTYDSILTKLEGYYAGELKPLYCVDDYEKCLHIEDIIDGKRIVVLEGGDLDGSSKKAIIGLISWGLFLYSRLKKNRDKVVDKRFYILEEAHRIIDNPDSKSGAPVLDVGENIFEILLNEAREYGVYCMIIVQTPSHLPPALVTNCAILIIHRLGNDEDITLMTQMLCRNARLDNRDVPLFLAKMPIGWACIRLNNRPMHQESEPALVQVARCPNNPPSNEELILTMDDVEIPNYIIKRMNDDSYLQMCKEGLDAFIEGKDNPIDRKSKDNYKNYEVDV